MKRLKEDQSECERAMEHLMKGVRSRGGKEDDKSNKLSDLEAVKMEGNE